MCTVEIIGAIDRQSHYNQSYILGLLESDFQALAVGTDFVGRPGTQIYVNSSDVLKIRSELAFTASEARIWLAKTLTNERHLAVHHPQKTWLLLTDGQGEVWVANICPRLYPLNIALKSDGDLLKNLDLLTALFAIYFALAKKSGIKLDEGLSNFAVDAEGRVYYLDDEYYGWDDFAAFSLMLSAYLRSFEWMDEAFIQALADRLKDVLLNVFADTQGQFAIAGHLQSVFMPNAHKEQVLKTLVKALQQVPDTKKAPPEMIVAAKKSVNRPVTGRFIALLGDIHGNYPALSRIMGYLNEQQITEGIVLGDTVGYGPYPKECIEALQDSGFQALMGNHDYGVATGDTDKGFSKDAKRVVDWTITELSPEHRAWLNALPPFIKQDNWYAVHGAPIDADYFYAYVYVMTYQDNLDYMQENGMALCFHGHSHMPGVFARQKYNDIQDTGKLVNLSNFQQALVSPGAVGQPRNGSLDAQFAIYDREQKTVKFMALPYDYESLIAKMRENHFPESLILRLLKGR